MTAHDLLPRATTRKLDLKASLKQLAANRSSGRYRLPDLLPCAGGSYSARANSTAYSGGDIRTVNAHVLMCEKAGTSGGSAPTITGGGLITDGTVKWHLLGYLAPVAFANSLALVLDQLFASGGKLYKVTAAGTTHASDPGPTTAAAGTSGTVSYIYAGEQTLPLLSVSGSAWGGTSYNDAASVGATILGGTQGAWPYAISSASSDGSAYLNSGSGGGGCRAFRTDSPKWSLAAGNDGLNGVYVWVDGQLAAWVGGYSGTGTRHLMIDGTALPRSLRDYRFDMPSNYKYRDVYCAATDTFAAYEPASAFKAVIVGDSFAEFTGMKSYGNVLGDLLGIEDFNVSGVGSSGIKKEGGGNTDLTGRWTVDVINHDPDLVIIQGSQADGTAVGAAEFTAAAVADDLEALVLRVRSETTAGRVIVMSAWNSTGALSSNHEDVETAIQAKCTALNVPYVDWSDFLTGSGYIGAEASNGNSDLMTSSDGTHPSILARTYRAERLAPLIVAAMEELI